MRLNWSAKRKRAWCTGLSLPRQIGGSSASALTGFLRVQGLMERIRARRSRQDSIRGALPAGRESSRADELERTASRPRPGITPPN